jgi:hypothetical protein
MNHPDQKTIELLALGSPEADKHREELVKHFGECEGCRQQYEEMREFYRALRVIEQQDSTFEEETRPRLLAQPGFIIPGSVTAIESKSGVMSIWRSVREHPRVSIGVLAAAIVLTSFLVCNTYKPIATSAHLNIYRQRLEVFDQRNKLMWEVPVAADSSFLREEEKHLFSYVLSDLSQDGVPELVTILDFPGDMPPYRHTLRVMENCTDTLWSRKPQIQSVAYRGTLYNEWYGHAYFLVTRNSAGNPLIVSMWNGMHSPAAEVVYDSRGRRTGDYWHFGQLQPAGTCDIDGDGTREVIAIGTNQSADDKMGFAVAVFLKPDRIIGSSQSVLTPGFGMPNSDAEVAYVRFPFSDLNLALHWGSGTVQLTQVGELLQFKVSSGGDDGVSRGSFTFDYTLDNHLRPLLTKGDENGRAYHADLLSRGLIHSRFDTTYTENLRRSVQFWNGSAWQAEPCTIHH